MEKKEYVLVERETIVQLIKKNFRAMYMILILEYVAQQKKAFITLSANEVCELLHIKSTQLEECRKRKWIKSVRLTDQTFLYSAYDVALLAEKIRRRKILRTIAKIPTVNNA